MSSMMSYDHYIDLQMIIDHAPMLYSLTNFVPDFQQQITFPFMYKVPLWIFRREKTKEENEGSQWATKGGKCTYIK